MAEGAKALNLSVSVNPAQGVFSFNISTDNVEIALEALRIVSKGAAALGALYVGYELLGPLIKTAVRNSLGGERDDQGDPDVEPGSLHVRVRCFTDARFLEVLTDYETGRIKQRLQEEFSQVGVKVEGLKVVIENMAEVNKTREAINQRRDNLIKVRTGRLFTCRHNYVFVPILVVLLGRNLKAIVIYLFCRTPLKNNLVSGASLIIIIIIVIVVIIT